MEASAVNEGEGPKSQDFQTDSSNEEVVDVIDVSEEDALRANFYALLARVLARPMDDDTLAFVRDLDGHDDSSELGAALGAFGALAARTSRAVAEEEFTVLFYGQGAGGEISPYASFYLTGLVYDKPLADLRDDMQELGIGVVDDNKEPEDHIASLCEMMHGLINGGFGSGVADLARQREFFNRHLAPWAVRVFEDLEAAEGSNLYAPVGTVGRLFMGIEGEGFRMAAP